MWMATGAWMGSGKWMRLGKWIGNGVVWGGEHRVWKEHGVDSMCIVLMC